MNTKKIVLAFYIESFTYRGTCTALFDYAYYNQKLLNNKSVIIYNDTAIPKNPDEQLVYDKFLSEFECVLFKSYSQLAKYNIDMVYCIKYGKLDNHFTYSNNCVFQSISRRTTHEKYIPTAVHCVFHMDNKNIHGDVYAGVSKSVAKGFNTTSKSTMFPYVDHIISLPDNNLDLRTELKIPKDAIVFGRLGGTDTFNIPFVKDAILDVVRSNDYQLTRSNDDTNNKTNSCEMQKVYFLFAVCPEMLRDVKSKYIISLEPFFDNTKKRIFINTCNAMIHASSLGESQGLNILEFSYCNKPVVTWNGGLLHKQHLENLGDYGIRYNNKNELYNIITNWNNIDMKRINFKNVCDKFTPNKIMADFKKVFIDPCMSSSL